MLKKTVFWIGLFLTLAYVWSVHPVGFQKGYVEDFCTFEMSRQIMADQLREKGSPHFETPHYRSPKGIETAFMPQSIEQTWLGAYFWNWNREFPFVWVYFGVSLVLTYCAIGFILKKMKLPIEMAWPLAAFFTVFHIPRHFKIWAHSELLFMHWVYLGFFLDAWIWQKFYRERSWSFQLEAWRFFFLIAVLGTAGYFWGPSLVEWMIVRICLVGMIIVWRKQAPTNPSLFEAFFAEGLSPSMDGKRRLSWRGILRPALLPIVLCCLWLAIEVQWFTPLLKKAFQLGKVSQGLSYHAPILMVVRPLWFEWIMQGVERVVPVIHGYWLSFQFPETKVTIGWVYWIPLLLGLRVLRKKYGGPGWGIVAPFIILLGMAIWYLGIKPHLVQYVLQTLIPPMSFFRVASRWGLFLPQIVGILFVLSWPEFQRWFQAQFNNRTKKFKRLFVLFICSSMLEMTWILLPPQMMAPFTPAMSQFLEKIRALPGTAVLDLPFCTIGGNSECYGECPSYPYSTVGACLRQWHDKDVYGIYESRLLSQQCGEYGSDPYLSWIRTWWSQKCFTSEQWKIFCDYLNLHPELSAVLVYPDLWKGAGTPECQALFREHLGDPLDEGLFFAQPTRGGIEQLPNRIWRFGARCRK